MKSKELRENYGVLIHQIAEFTRTEKEKNNGILPAEKFDEYDRMVADAKKLKQDYEGLERTESFDEELLKTLRKPEVSPNHNTGMKRQVVTQADYDLAVSGWIGSTVQIRNDRWDEAQHKLGWTANPSTADITGEQIRTMGTNQTGYGAELITATLSDRFLFYRKAYGGLQNWAYNWTSDTGEDQKVDYSDDVLNLGSVVGEGCSDTAVDVPTAQVTISLEKYTSNVCKVTYEMLTDTKYPLAEYIAKQLSTRVYRRQAANFISGTGAVKGLFSNATSAGTCASASAITYAEVRSLLYSIDPAWRLPGACWIAADSMANLVFGLSDDQHRPLLQNSLVAGQPDMVLGYPFITDGSVAAVTNSSKSLGFGYLPQAYSIRKMSGGMNFAKTSEGITLLQDQKVAMVCWERCGARLVDANAFKILTMHS